MYLFFFFLKGSNPKIVTLNSQVYRQNFKNSKYIKLLQPFGLFRKLLLLPLGNARAKEESLPQ